MSFSVRNGFFDLVIVAGPGVGHWPTIGAEAASLLCADMGLKVGVFGGPGVNPLGVIPLPGTGGLLVFEDSQNRVHRIQARAIIKICSDDSFPDPFPGWNSEALIPYSTAVKLLESHHVNWDPGTVVLGTGNKALRFGSKLLERGIKEVTCIEIHGIWRKKRISGWEVEQRRFQMLGGKVLEAELISLKHLSPLVWTLKVHDEIGVKIMEVARVVSVGPFSNHPKLKEYPSGSFLFELTQSSPKEKLDDILGWRLEEERGRFVAAKIVRTLGVNLEKKKVRLEALYRRSRNTVRDLNKHLDEPFVLDYEGLFLSKESKAQLLKFSGIPRKDHLARKVAFIECFESIECRVCEASCPDSAIKIDRKSESFLIESKCTACSLCLSACPSQSIALVHEVESQSLSLLTLIWSKKGVWKKNEVAQMLNRKGEVVGTTHIMDVKNVEGSKKLLIEVKVPTHLVNEVRALRKISKPSSDDVFDKDYSDFYENTVDVHFDGEKRLVRESIPVAVSLYEIGRSRSEDKLMCDDSSCKLCSVIIDGMRKLSCQTLTHKGMAIKLKDDSKPVQEDALCPCLNIESQDVVKRIRDGNLKSPEAVLSASKVGQGTCQGRLCLESFKRLLEAQGIDVSEWIDWRFPWARWSIFRSNSNFSGKHQVAD